MKSDLAYIEAAARSLAPSGVEVHVTRDPCLNAIQIRLTSRIEKLILCSFDVINRLDLFYDRGGDALATAIVKRLLYVHDRFVRGRAIVGSFDVDAAFRKIAGGGS